MKRVMSDCSCTFKSSSAYEIKDPDMMYDKIIKNFEEFAHSGGEVLSFWEDDVNISTLIIIANKEHGICLTHDTYYKKLIGNKERIAQHTHLAVYDKTKLEEVIDIGDELYTSVGLVFPPEIAWKGISEFIRTGNMSLELEWITPDVIPENGNWC